MNRHVFPRATLSLLCVLAALSGVRAQDGEDPPPDEPRPAEVDGDAEGAQEPPADEEPAEPEEPTPPAVGEPFPAHLPIVALPKSGDEIPALESADGEPLATFVGDEPRPVIFVFWSSRCAVCTRYGEVLRKLETALAEKVAIVLVASGADETPDAARKARDAAKLGLPVWLDTEKKAAAALGVRVTPTAFLVDAQGVLRYRGPIDDDRRARSRDARELLRPAAEAVLAGKDVENGDVRSFGSALR